MDYNNEKVIICIGTVNLNTFNLCKKNVINYFSKHSAVKKIEIIKNLKPKYMWLNRMAEISIDYDWCLQVDEDMYLYPESLDKLLKFAIANKNLGVKIANASGLLNDLFLGHPVGSLKLWNTEIFKYIKFKDILGSDRQFAKESIEKGFINISINDILGDHDSAPTPEKAYNKYYEYTEKIYKFNGIVEAEKFNIFLKNKFLKEKTIIAKKALDGSSKKIKDLNAK